MFGRQFPRRRPHDDAVFDPPAALTLVPYGCTNLRVTEFPLLADVPDSGET